MCDEAGTSLTADDGGVQARERPRVLQSGGIVTRWRPCRHPLTGPRRRACPRSSFTAAPARIRPTAVTSFGRACAPPRWPAGASSRRAARRWTPWKARCARSRTTRASTRVAARFSPATARSKWTHRSWKAITSSAAPSRPSLASRIRSRSRAASSRRGGTVGAVALDRSGTIAAATSTGGTIGKLPGRVGDSALIGCGTYAESSIGGVSCTGDGEAIIRVVLGHRALYFLKDAADPEYAAKIAVDLLVEEGRGHGGLILLDWRGRTGYACSTPLMPVAIMSPALGEPRTPF